MDAVRMFNSELSSLYETKPPVSRAKMASITKAAIKAIKFYKHVVQSVEKFVMKCKPEYKIPGLYVIDSVVRQSRHQFGGDKDVFGPRFTKNIVTTFQSLLKCPEDERGRIIRVLNLWQKNSVFPVEVIQPLIDMASSPSSAESVLSAQRAVEKVVLDHQRSVGKAPNGGTEESVMAQQTDIVNTVTRLLQQTGENSLVASGQGVQLQQLQLLQQQLVMHTELMSNKSQQTPPVIDNDLLAQIKLLTDQLLSKSDAPTSTSAPPPPVVMAQSMPETSVSSERRVVPSIPASMMMGNGTRESQNMPEPAVATIPRESKKPVEPGFNKKLLDFDYSDSDEEEEPKEEPKVQQQLPGGVHQLLNDPVLMQHIHNVSSLKSEQLRPDLPDPEAARKQHLEQQQEQFNKEIGQSQYSAYRQDPEVIVVEDQDERDSRDYDRDRRRSRHSRDRSRSPRRRRHSRSRSRERRRSRDRHRRSRSRDYDRERQREKERERRKKGLPPLKDKHISVCSTTLWFGHLAKYTTEDELRSEIENYGTTESIKMVPPRGCAFVNMTWRKDAAKALDRMKGLKLNSSALRVAWAPNIGVKESQFKDMWDVEMGVTYIPWESMPADLTPLLDGAMVDEDSLPNHLKGTVVGKAEKDGKERSTDSFNAPPGNQIPVFGGQNQAIPSSQQMSMVPPPLMMPPPGHLLSGIPIPPPNTGPLPLRGQMLAGPNNPPHGLPPNILPPVGPVSTPMSLPVRVSLSQVVPATTSLQVGLPGSSAHAPNMDGSLNRPPGLPLISSSPLMPPIQQPGNLARPGFPGGPPFGLPPNIRPGLPLPGQGLRPTFQEVEEPKEWPGDDKLEEEALAEMDEEDSNQRVGISSAPTPLIPLPVMRMGVPGAPRLPVPLTGSSPRPNMMVELPQPVSSPGMPLGRPGLLGPQLIQPGTPQEGADGILRPQLPPGLLSQGAVGIRLGVGSPGPRRLAPGSLPLGQQLGIPGSPGMRGMGPGGGPIRFVLGQRPSLVRPGGPFSVETSRPQLGDAPSSNQTDQNLLEDGPLGPAVSNPSAPRGPGGPPGLLMGAALRGGRPSLLGARPNIPVNGGLPLGPGAVKLRGPTPDFIRGPAINKPLGESSQGGLPLNTESQDDESPAYGEGDSSPEYGDGFDETENGRQAAQDTRFHGDSRKNTRFQPSDMNQHSSSIGTKAGTERTKSGRVSRWSNCTDEDNANIMPQDRLAGANGSAVNTFHPSSRNEPSNVPTSQTVSQGMSEG